MGKGTIRSGWILGLLLAAGCTPPQQVEPPIAEPDTKTISEIKPIHARPWTDLKQHTFTDVPIPMVTPSVSHDGKWLVYAAGIAGYPGYQIFAKPIDALTVTQLTYNAANNLTPRFSPDGKYVAFASDKEGNWDIYVLALDNPLSVMQITLTVVDEFEPDWSPDGKRIVCSASTAPGGGHELKIIDLQTRAMTLLGAGTNPVWGADKDDPEGWIAFELGDANQKNKRVMVTRPDGTDVIEIMSHQAQGYATDPAWSPKGDWLAFTWHNLERGTRELWLAKPDGTMKLRMMDDPEPSDHASWGGERIFFLVKNDLHNIYSIKPYPLELLEE